MSASLKLKDLDDSEKEARVSLRHLLKKLESLYHLLDAFSNLMDDADRGKFLIVCQYVQNVLDHLDQGKRFSTKDKKCSQVRISSLVKPHELGYVKESFDEFTNTHRTKNCFPKSCRMKFMHIIDSMKNAFDEYYDYFQKSKKLRTDTKFNDYGDDRWQPPQQISQLVPTLPHWFKKDDWMKFLPLLMGATMDEAYLKALCNPPKVVPPQKQTSRSSVQKNVPPKKRRIIEEESDSDEDERNEAANKPSIPPEEADIVKEAQNAAVASSTARLLVMESNQSKKNIAEHSNSDKENECDLRSTQPAPVSQALRRTSRVKGVNKEENRLTHDKKTLVQNLRTSIFIDGKSLRGTHINSVSVQRDLGITYAKDIRGYGKCQYRMAYAIGGQPLLDQFISQNLTFKDESQIKDLVSNYGNKDCRAFRLGSSWHWMALTPEYFIDEHLAFPVKCYGVASMILAMQDGIDVDCNPRSLVFPPNIAYLPSLEPVQGPHGLVMKPNILQLTSMSESELKSVSNFSVCLPGVARIDFLEDVDVREANITKSFTFGHMKAGVDHKGAEVGQKLNVPANITYYQVHFSGPKHLKAFQDSIIDAPQSFVSYDRHKKELVISVPHFSQYDMSGHIGEEHCDDDQWEDKVEDDTQAKNDEDDTQARKQRNPVWDKIMPSFAHEYLIQEEQDYEYESAVVTSSSQVDFNVVLELKPPYLRQILQEGYYLNHETLVIGLRYLDLVAGDSTFVHLQMKETMDLENDITEQTLRQMKNADTVLFLLNTGLPAGRRKKKDDEPEHYVYCELRNSSSEWKAELDISQIYGTWQPNKMAKWYKKFLKWFFGAKVKFRMISDSQKRPVKPNQNTVKVHYQELPVEQFPGSGDDTSCGWVSLCRAVQRLEQLHPDNTEIKAVSEILNPPNRFATIRFLLRALTELRTAYTRDSHSSKCGILRLLSSTVVETAENWSEDALFEKMAKLNRVDLKGLLCQGDCLCGIGISSYGPSLYCTNCLGSYHPLCAIKKFQYGNGPFQCDYCGKFASEECPMVLSRSPRVFRQPDNEIKAGTSYRSVVLEFMSKSVNDEDLQSQIEIMQSLFGKHFTEVQKYEKHLERLSALFNNEGGDSATVPSAEDIYSTVSAFLEEGSPEDVEGGSSVTGMQVEEELTNAECEDMRKRKRELHDKYSSQMSFSTEKLQADDTILVLHRKKPHVATVLKNMSSSVRLRIHDGSSDDGAAPTVVSQSIEKIQECIEQYKVGSNGKIFLPCNGLDVLAFNSQRCEEIPGIIRKVDEKSGYVYVSWKDSGTIESDPVPFTFVRPRYHDGLSITTENSNDPSLKVAFMGVQCLFWVGMPVILHLQHRNLPGKIEEIQPYYAKIKFDRCGPKDPEYHPFMLLSPVDPAAYTSDIQGIELSRRSGRKKPKRFDPSNTGQSTEHSLDVTSEYILRQKKNHPFCNNGRQKSLMVEDFEIHRLEQQKRLSLRTGKVVTFKFDANRPNVSETDISDLPLVQRLEHVKEAVESWDITYTLLSSFMINSISTDARLSVFSQMPVYAVFISKVVADNGAIQDACFNLRADGSSQYTFILHAASFDLDDSHLIDELNEHHSFLSRFEVIWALSNSNSECPNQIYQDVGDIGAFMRYIHDSVFGGPVETYNHPEDKTWKGVIDNYFTSRSRIAEDAPRMVGIPEEQLEIILQTSSLVEVIENTKLISFSALLDNCYKIISAGDGLHGVGLSATLESTSCYRLAIRCNGEKDFRIFCKHCKRDCCDVAFAELIDAISNIAIVGPLHLLSQLHEQRHSSLALSDTAISKHPFLLLSQDDAERIPSSIMTCKPSSSQSTDACLGHDQYILSAINTAAQEDHCTWKSLTDLLKTDRARELIHQLEQVLIGETDASSCLTKTIDQPILRYMDADDNCAYSSDNLTLEELIAKGVTEIIMIDLNDPTFPRELPNDFLIDDEVRNGLNQRMGEDTPLHRVVPIREVLEHNFEHAVMAAYAALPKVSLPFLFDESTTKLCILKAKLQSDNIEIYTEITTDYSFYTDEESESEDGSTFVQMVISPDLFNLLWHSKKKGGNRKKLSGWLGRLKHNEWTVVSNDFKRNLQHLIGGSLTAFAANKFAMRTLQPYLATVTGNNPSDVDNLTFSQTMWVASSTFGDGSDKCSRVLNRLTNACFTCPVDAEQVTGFTLSKTKMIPHQRKILSTGRRTSYGNDYTDSIPATSHYDGESNSTKPGCSLSCGTEPLPYNEKMTFSKTVNLERWNCMSANVQNTLDILGHSSIIEGISFQACKSMTNLKQILRGNGYQLFALSKNMSFDVLSKFIEEVRLPLIVDLEVPVDKINTVLHVIGIVPNPENDGALIVEGGISTMSPIVYSKQNLDYVCGAAGFSQTGDNSFALLPGKTIGRKLRESSTIPKSTPLHICCMPHKPNQDGNIITQPSKSYANLIDRVKESISKL